MHQTYDHHLDVTSIQKKDGFTQITTNEKRVNEFETLNYALIFLDQ